MKATIRINSKTHNHVETLRRFGYEVEMGQITKKSKKTQKEYLADVAIVEVSGFVTSSADVPVDISTKELMLSACRSVVTVKQAFSYQTHFRMPDGETQKAGAGGFAALRLMAELSCLVMNPPASESKPKATPVPIALRANLADALLGE